MVTSEASAYYLGETVGNEEKRMLDLKLQNKTYHNI